VLDQLPMSGGQPAQQSEPEPVVEDAEEVPIPDIPDQVAEDFPEEEPVKLASITEPAELAKEELKKKPEKKPEPKPKEKPKTNKPKVADSSGEKKDTLKTVIGEGEVSTHVGVGTAGVGSGGGTFPYDIRRAVQQIDRNWVNPVLSQKTLKCVIYFQIQRNGKIKGAAVEETSGDSQFDLYALAAVQRTADLPPLPRSYDYDVLGFHLEFEYKP